MITMQELVRDTVQVHGHRWTAEHFKRRIPFTIFYWLVFGCLPRVLVVPPTAWINVAHPQNCLQMAHRVVHRMLSE